MTDVRKSRRTRLPKASSMLLTDQRRRKDGTQIWKLAYPSVFDPDHSKRPRSICVPGTNDLQHTRRESPKELSRPLARERDITSRSESRCRRQLYKAGGAFSLPRRLLLASAASNPTTVLSARVFSARVIPTASHCASCLFSSRLGSRFDSRSNPSEIARALPGPAPPLSRFLRHGEGKDYTLAFGVGVVTRVAFCVYNTKCRRKAASWLLRSMTLRSHFGTCPAPAGKCALKRAVRSLSFANKAQPFALARVIIIRVDYQSTRMQETEKISHRPPAACEKSGELCH